MFYCFPLLLLYCTRYTYVIVNYTIYIQYIRICIVLLPTVYTCLFYGTGAMCGLVGQYWTKNYKLCRPIPECFYTTTSHKASTKVNPDSGAIEDGQERGYWGYTAVFVTRGLLSHRRPSEGRQRTVRKVLAYLWYLTDDAIAKLYVMESFVK